jgi:hypothetical protein
VADFGNKPGEGSLRFGGVTPTVPVGEESDLPSTLSHAAKSQRKALMVVRDAWAGTEAVRDTRGAVYLPQNEAEEQVDYQSRLVRSVFYNAFRRTVEGLAGLVFRRNPELGDDVPAPIQTHWENIDNAGTHGDVFARDLLADALTSGHAAILVDFPDTGGAQSAAQEMGPEGLRPYWVPIKKEQLLSWRTVVEAGRTLLSQVVIEERSYVPNGEYGEKEAVQYRVLYREVGGLVGWKVLAVSENKQVTTLAEGVYPTQSEIPLSEIPTSGRYALFESTPPLLDLAYLNIAHFQQWSDYATSIFKTCVPVFYAFGVTGKQDADGNPSKVYVGPNTAVIDRNENASVGYAAHDGAALGSCKASLDELKSDMGTLGLAMLAPQKRVAETAEAKRLDKATSDSALAVAARGLQDGIERALQFHANYMKLESGGSITINRDFEGLLMEPDVMAAFAALVRDVGLPARVVLKALKEGGRLPEDEDPEMLEAETMANAAADAERRREERELFLNQPNVA